VSGLAALHLRQGGSVERRSVLRMLQRMRHRVPCGDELWCEGAVGFGAPPACLARATVAPSTTVAVALDGRLDNRPDLARLLDVGATALERTSDAELVLRAYERWGDACVARLVGDFALVLWDGRRRRILAARDALGARTLYYHVSSRRLALASEARALLALAGPWTLDDDRIADYLVPPLEGADRTSTFYREIRRLPAAHRLVLDPTGVALERYWSPADVPELRTTAEDGVEAFRATFAEAVRCRITGPLRVGAMLSGGVDSSAIVGFAARERLERGDEPLPTFSAVAGAEHACSETSAIQSMLARPGLSPTRVGIDDLGPLLPQLGEILDRLDEPFDATMIVPMLAYLLARRVGLGAVLDGVDGDVVASLEPDFLGLLLRAGAWRATWREAGALASFYEGSYRPWSSRSRLLARAARRAWVPAAARQAVRRTAHGRRVADRLRESILGPDLRRRARVGERLATLWAEGAVTPSSPREYHVAQLDHPFLAVAVERYDRVAALAAIEARHPFLDRRVVELAVALPWHCKVRDGWPKWIVREACRGLVPDDVRWRRGRWQRLGPAFLQEVVRRCAGAVEQMLHEGRESLAPYVDARKLDAALERFRASGDPVAGEWVWSAAQLAAWLRRQSASIVEEESEMKEPKDEGGTDSKCPYHPPKLTEYGALKDLTAGGSGSANEGSQGLRPRP